MLVGKFIKKMINYYVVFVSRKGEVCDSSIECQRSVIFYKKGLDKAYTSKDRATRMLYPPR